MTAKKGITVSDIVTHVSLLAILFYVYSILSLYIYYNLLFKIDVFTYLSISDFIPQRLGSILFTTFETLISALILFFVILAVEGSPKIKITDPLDYLKNKVLIAFVVTYLILFLLQLPISVLMNIFNIRFQYIYYIYFPIMAVSFSFAVYAAVDAIFKLTNRTVKSYLFLSIYLILTAMAESDYCYDKAAFSNKYKGTTVTGKTEIYKSNDTLKYIGRTPSCFFFYRKKNSSILVIPGDDKSLNLVEN